MVKSPWLASIQQYSQDYCSVYCALRLQFQAPFIPYSPVDCIVAADRESAILWRSSSEWATITQSSVYRRSRTSDFVTFIYALRRSVLKVLPSVLYVIWIPGSESSKAERSIILKRKLKSEGARTHPCLTLLVTGNSSPSLPLTNLAFTPSWKHLIIFTILGGIPVRGRMFHTQGRDTVSKALVMSTKRMYRSIICSYISLGSVLQWISYLLPLCPGEKHTGSLAL